jgi:calcineurin-like phosphoesterase family protein
MRRWFTSDTHFGHANALKFGRPFSTMEEMDETMIAHWNTAIGVDDEVWHLGDFAWPKKPDRYLERLRGKLHLVIGNHDHKESRTHPRWQSAQHFVELKTEKGAIVLCHYALEVWNKSHYGVPHFHGHSHGNLRARGRRLDVGVDPHGFAPLSEEKALELALSHEPWTPDHHQRPEVAK